MERAELCGDGEAGALKRWKPRTAGAGMENPNEPWLLRRALGARGKMQFLCGLCPSYPYSLSAQFEVASVVFEDTAFLL